MPSQPFAETGQADPPSPIRADVHLHTAYSHGQAGTKAMYQAARDRGLDIIGFSEHSPRPLGYAYPSDYQQQLTAGFPDYIREVQALRGLEPDVRVLLGLEADYIPGREDFAADLIRSQPYDYVIGGLHFQGDWGFDFSANDWEGLSRRRRFAAYAAYYDDLAAMCRCGLFHIAAHPDLIKIFTPDSFREWLATDEAADAVRAALTAMRDNGLLMEVSSAGLRKPCREIYPGPVIMTLAAELGLDISFGSDAHCTNTPAYAFDQLARYAAHFGFTRSFVVEQGKRKALPFTAPL